MGAQLYWALRLILALAGAVLLTAGNAIAFARLGFVTWPAALIGTAVVLLVLYMETRPDERS